MKEYKPSIIPKTGQFAVVYTFDCGIYAESYVWVNGGLTMCESNSNRLLPTSAEDLENFLSDEANVKYKVFVLED